MELYQQAQQHLAVVSNMCCADALGMKIYCKVPCFHFNFHTIYATYIAQYISIRYELIH